MLAVGQEKIGEIDETAVKALGAFGGGIASSGSVCGILIGGIAVISSIYSRGNLDEKENPLLWSVSSKFLKKFEELAKPLGGMNCRDIAKVDWKNKLEVKNYYVNPLSTRKICIKLVGDAAYALGELIDQQSEKD
ncbi:MAG: C-GCAxxG-C-C family protein [Thermodesulfobacteriota bacterium]